MKNCTVTSLKDFYKNVTIISLAKKLNIGSDKIIIKSMKDITNEGKEIPTHILGEAKKEAKEKMKNFLNSFACEKNEDVQNFFRNDSIKYDENSLSRTFFILDKDVNKREELVEKRISSIIVGYFTLSFKHVLNYSEKVKFLKESGLPVKKVSYDRRNDILNAILIAQLGKNDNYKYKKDINLTGIMAFILDKIRLVRDHIGTNIILIEVDKGVPELIDLYSKNGFCLLKEIPNNCKEVENIEDESSGEAIGPFLEPSLTEGLEGTKEELTQLMMLDTHY